MGTIKPGMNIVYSGLPYSGKATNLSSLLSDIPSDLKVSIEPINESCPHLVEFSFWGPLPSDRKSWAELKEGRALPVLQAKRLYQVQTLSGTFWESKFGYLQKMVSDFDGLVFVVDGDPERTDANIEQLFFLIEVLEKAKCDWEVIPWVFQMNKLDLEKTSTLEEILQDFCSWPAHRRCVNASAINGEGVWETFFAIIEQVEKAQSSASTLSS